MCVCVFVCVYMFVSVFVCVCVLRVYIYVCVLYTVLANNYMTVSGNLEDYREARLGVLSPTEVFLQWVYSVFMSAPPPSILLVY